MAAEPLFLDGPAGRLFAIYHPAAAGAPAAPALVFLPPFAEEMNRARRMVAVAARAFAGRGRAVLLLDPHGTGESDGEFADARWEVWRADARAALAWMRGRGHAQVGLWGLRLGALLAAEVAREADAGAESLLLWQPVTSGRQFLTQFLRIRLAAALTRGGEGAETTQTLRAALAEGGTLEIAGYALTGALAAAIEARELAALAPPLAVPARWLEVAGEAGPDLPPGSARIVEGWRGAGAAVAAAVVAGDPFWATPETTTAPALIAASLAAAAESAPA